MYGAPTYGAAVYGGFAENTDAATAETTDRTLTDSAQTGRTVAVGQTGMTKTEPITD